MVALKAETWEGGCSKFWCNTSLGERCTRQRGKGGKLIREFQASETVTQCDSDERNTVLTSTAQKGLVHLFEVWHRILKKFKYKSHFMRKIILASWRLKLQLFRLHVGDRDLMMFVLMDMLLLLATLRSSTMLYPSLCWNDDQHKEPMIDTKIIYMGN